MKRLPLALAVLTAAIFSLTVVPRASTTPTGTISLTAHGAVCDGASDDYPALKGALDDLRSRGGGTLRLPAGTCRIVLPAAAPLSIDQPITIEGVGPSSVLGVDRPQADDFVELFRISASKARLANLSIERLSDGPTVMMQLRNTDQFVLDRVILDGRNDVFTQSYSMGIMFAPGDQDAVRRTVIRDSQIINSSYGLFQPNATTGTVSDFLVTRTVFRRNAATDLEFNAPEGTMTNIRVTNNSFRNNSYSDRAANAGFGVGLANVQDAVISGNSFDGYWFSPVHIEDRSAQVRVSGNQFTRSFTLRGFDFASHVIILSGSHHITITGNVFDTTGSADRVAAVWAGAGGAQVPAPTDVTVSGNRLRLKPSDAVMDNHAVQRATLSDNTVTLVP